MASPSETSTVPPLSVGCVHCRARVEVNPPVLRWPDGHAEVPAAWSKVVSCRGCRKRFCVEWWPLAGHSIEMASIRSTFRPAACSQP